MRKEDFKKWIRNKRITFWEKAWYVVKPFLVYMVLKSVAMLTLAMLLPMLPIDGMAVWVEDHSRMLNAVVNGAASLIAVAFLLNDFLKEVATAGEVNIDAGIPRQLLTFLRRGFWGYDDVNGVGLALCAGGGAVAAFVLNEAVVLLLALLRLDSARYASVEEIQYSVPLWLGLLLYGVISPIVEEIVFRGILYNRMKRFFGIPACVILTALLFGGFHANLPQFAYGTCMGILLALCYEIEGSFAAPVLFHMAANVFVFLLSFS
ncbi:MAG: CPBP family intramembrane metalloprotease [Roseburia sp.]|nr:CPBP family intramembrane metalloprotease [Roseburia sp.]